MSWNNKNRKTVGSVITGLLRMVIVGVAVYAAALLLLRICGVKAYIVMSGSMEPEIRTGSLCLISGQVPFDEIVTGDIIAFETAGGMVTHRVIGRKGQVLETKGDANDISDGYTTSLENYRGKTICSIPCLGYLHFALNRNRIGVLSLLALSTLYNGIRQNSEEKQGEFDEFLQKK